MCLFLICYCVRVIFGGSMCKGNNSLPSNILLFVMFSVASLLFAIYIYTKNTDFYTMKIENMSNKVRNIIYHSHVRYFYCQFCTNVGVDSKQIGYFGNIEEFSLWKIVEMFEGFCEWIAQLFKNLIRYKSMNRWHKSQ